MMGMVSAACPLVDETGMWISAWTGTMSAAETARGRCCSGCASSWTRVSMMCPPANTSEMARATPMNKAGASMVSIPFSSSTVVSRHPIRASRPTANPASRNMADSSLNPQPSSSTP